MYLLDFPFSDVATNEEEDENGIRLQVKPVKSYTRAKPINTSITASPPKKMKKKVLFPFTVFIVLNVWSCQKVLMFLS